VIRPEITKLYRYFPLSEYSLRSLETRAFWFSRPCNFNDPFDCALTLVDDAIRESVHHALHALAQRGTLDVDALPTDAWEVRPEDIAAYKRYQEQMLGVTDEIGLMCLSEVNDDLLMWSHYADRHQGFCLGFERSPGNIVGRQAAPVVYQRAYPRLSLIDFDRTTNPNSANVLWLTKSDHWAYEREWRLMALKGDRSYSIDASICSIIFGLRMNDTARAAVRAALVGLKTVQWYEAFKSPTAFALEIRAIPSCPPLGRSDLGVAASTPSV